MDTVILSICLTVAVVALILSGLSLVLHWIRRAETVEYSALSNRLTNMDLSLIEAVDKFKHFANRQTQRTAREAADKAREEPEAPVAITSTKEQLRSKLRRRQAGEAAA